jgi:hypothetical protein
LIGHAFSQLAVDGISLNNLNRALLISNIHGGVVKILPLQIGAQGVRAGGSRAWG